MAFMHTAFKHFQPVCLRKRACIQTCNSSSLDGVLNNYTKYEENNIPEIKTGAEEFTQSETGKPYTAPNRILNGICRKQGVKHIGFHGIRHTAGTRLAERGVPINVIQAVLAHTDIRTTMRYVHLQDSAIKEAIIKLNSYH